ncbi:M28 family metallopeptidase [Enemella evansiae]|uniref:M28 family metallopeptidase n=1 Tax=Enemella evansiae TaxID=2016499 RepID=UPI000B963C8D|nr:M28 family peptidase [Enemella evansiae]OYN99873.1 Zn-dependent exopeptidase M28 [Enemella evansiae]
MKADRNRQTVRRSAAGLAVAAVIATSACTASDSGQPVPSPAVGPTASPAPSTTPTPSPAPTPTPSATPSPAPAVFETERAMADVRTLAGDIGPRLATGPEFDRAAGLVAERFTGLGFRVARQEFEVPAGDSWGTPVAAGSSANVIAEPFGFDPARPYRIVGAHLDTIAVAPGAEDNASGVAVMLELARMAAQEQNQQVRFIAFGAEEPRAQGDANHHYGSLFYVDELARQPGELAGMISLDRVGVRSDRVPISNGGPRGLPVRNDLRAAADRVGVPVQPTDNNRASDHWSFEKAGLPAARIGSVPYAGYHSRRDTPDVIDPRQLERVGQLAWAWLSSPAG